MNIDKRSVYQCVRCGTCRSVCPVFQEMGWESYNTRGRMLVTKRLLEGGHPDPSSLDSLHTCTTCGICTLLCPAGMRPPSLVEDARRELVNLGFITEKQARMGERVRHSGNSLGEFSERLGWLSEQPRKTADFVYFVGCLDSYRYPETAARTFQILKPFGTTVLSKEMCCGSPLLCSGLDASESISSNLEQIRKVGADTVITGCAGCFTTLNGYPGDLRVLSVPEFLAEHLGELDLRPLEITVAYHDPCHLGRIYKIYDAPRQVIKAICHLEEMAAVRESSRCCGGGGGVRASYSELSLKLARRRLEDVPEGVDYVVTTCPLCVRNLRDAGGRAIDLVELVGMAMDGILIQ